MPLPWQIRWYLEPDLLPGRDTTVLITQPMRRLNAKLKAAGISLAPTGLAQLDNGSTTKEAAGVLVRGCRHSRAVRLRHAGRHLSHSDKSCQVMIYVDGCTQPVGIRTLNL